MHASIAVPATITPQTMSGQDILTVNGHALKAVGIGDICIELPNGTMHTKALHKDAIHAPEMAFTLISISQSDDANSSVTFTKAMCTIKDAKGHIMATIPQAHGLYHLTTPTNENKSEHANIAARKMSIQLREFQSLGSGRVSLIIINNNLLFDWFLVSRSNNHLLQ